MKTLPQADIQPSVSEISRAERRTTTSELSKTPENRNVDDWRKIAHGDENHDSEDPSWCLQSTIDDAKLREGEDPFHSDWPYW